MLNAAIILENKNDSCHKKMISSPVVNKLLVVCNYFLSYCTNQSF